MGEIMKKVMAVLFLIGFTAVFSTGNAFSAKVPKLFKRKCLQLTAPDTPSAPFNDHYWALTTKKSGMKIRDADGSFKLFSVGGVVDLGLSPTYSYPIFGLANYDMLIQQWKLTVTVRPGSTGAMCTYYLIESSPSIFCDHPDGPQKYTPIEIDCKTYDFNGSSG